jgi:hypothetical protein
MSEEKALALVPRTISEATALSTQLVQSGLLPDHIKNPQQAFAIITMGAELGLAPWAALNGINVIRGKPTISGQLMLALVRNSGKMAAFSVDERTAERCTITVQRDGEAPVTVTFTMDEARALGLAGKDNYSKQPAVMLQWRCVAAICRLVFPDVLQGFVYTPEEINPDLLVDEDGAIVEGYMQEAEDYAQREADLNGAAQALRPDDEELVSSPIPTTDEVIASFGRGVEGYNEGWSEEARLQVSARLAQLMGQFIGANIYYEDEGSAFYAPLGLSRTAAIKEARLLVASVLCGEPIESFNDMTSPQLYALDKLYGFFKARGKLAAVIDNILTEWN